MNPDIQKDIAEGRCVRTIYITSGDAGSSQFYWLGREQGSEAAYSKMLGDSNLVWIQRIVKLADNQYVTITNPVGNTKVSLIFMHLPDGNLAGQGFYASQYESLHKLLQGQIQSVHSIYGGSAYTDISLMTALAGLMRAYQPSEIRTQATHMSTRYPDHSDHMSVSRFAEKAYKIYEISKFNDSTAVPIKHYFGYPIHAMEANVTDGDLESKTAVFLSYAKHDGSVCQTVQSCLADQAYGAYLRRQYTQ